MSVDLKIQNNLDKMIKKLDTVSKNQWPTILSKTTRVIAEKVRDKLKREMPSYLDRPNAYTVNSLFAMYGNKSKPDSTVKWKNGSGTSAGHYLVPQVDGQGMKRPLKPFERKLQGLGLMPNGWAAIPTKDMRTDSFGNIPAPTLYKIIRGVTQSKISITKKGRVKNATVKGGYFINLIPSSETPMGIYERKVTGFGEALRLVVAYIPEARYKRRFPFYGVGQAVATRSFDIELGKAIEANKVVS